MTNNLQPWQKKLIDAFIKAKQEGRRLVIARPRCRGRPPTQEQLEDLLDIYKGKEIEGVIIDEIRELT